MKKKQIIPAPPSHYLIDSHCHLDMEQYQEDLTAVLARGSQYNIKKIITIGTNLASSERAIALAKQYDNIWATVGIHPHDVENADQSSYGRLKEYALSSPGQVVGYGEIGLDYAKLYTNKKTQKQHFASQLQLAKELNLPISVHCRDAFDDLQAILKEAGKFPASGVIHCFSGDIAFAEEMLAMGFYISIPGIVTFKKAETLQDVAAFVPKERLLIETDGPFLAPTPYRGKRNEPLYLLYTLQKIAELRGVSMDNLAQITSTNCEQLFNI